VGGFNHFVFRQGTGQVTIEDFDHHAGSAFSHAQGDVIDLRDYHMSGFNEVWQHVTVNANGDAVINLPAAHHDSQVTLVGVHPFQLVPSDFVL
jgi:hypothetical protein